MNNQQHTDYIQRDDKINLREELEKYLVNWKWFALTIFLSLLFAYIYLRYTDSKYMAETSILIDDSRSGTSPEVAAFQEIGMLSGQKNRVDNEIEVLKSRKIVGEAIKRLNLEISYFIKSRVKETELYKNSPIQVNFTKKKSKYYNLSAEFLVRSISKSQFELESNSEITVHNFNEVISTKFGDFEVLYNLEKGERHNSFEIIVRLSSLDVLIGSYQSNLGIQTASRLATVLDINFTNTVSDKAVDFLDMLVYVYNEDAINYKNQVSIKTKEFIEDRLLLIGRNKDSINNSLLDFKNKNGVINIAVESQLALENFTENNKKIIEVNTQLKLIESLLEELSEKDNVRKLLPSNLGLENAAVSKAIADYNTLVLRKIKLKETASEINPEIISLNSIIDASRPILIENLKNAKKGFELSLKQLEKEKNTIRNKISNVPNQELEFLDIRLQQEIIANLYSYLLKKKEETSIAVAVAVPNAKIVDSAYSKGGPISPKKKIIYIIALIIGLFIPFIVIYLKYLFDTKIHSRKEVEALTSVPFIGDVPHSEEEAKVVINKDSRSSTAEAFRLIRTNLNFLLPNDKNQEGKVIFVTSTTSGEGKSFISINLAVALSLSNKKVLLLGMDLRAPKVTEYLGLEERKGITNFITNKNIDLDELKFSIDQAKALDIVSSGVIPPNPAELLMTERVKGLFEEVKNDYDYIIVDTAPVNLVTDTLLISEYADMVLYVTRADYLDKRMLVVPETLYKEKKLPNMGVVLNDTDVSKGGGGYGYGYGYGYVEQVSKPWYKRIFG